MPQGPRRKAGLVNFRDFGDCPTTTGARVARGRLYRSAHLSGLEAEALSTLAGLGLDLIVDLRHDAERRREPSRLPPGLEGRTLFAPADPAREGDALHVSALARALGSGRPARDIMIESYRRAPFETDRVALFAVYFRRLAEADGAVLIHCTAGKDRTGLLVALTQALLGVHRDDIMAEYLLSLDAFDALSATLSAWLEANGLGAETVDPALLRPLIGVEAAYLETALAAIEAEHGSIEDYGRQRLGIDDDLRARLHRRFHV
ncbi:tyrosine-protein phosphatase [Zavarzinia aquatilis]|uniref:Protein-tyrosine-phosphatase n=1 Tax=Zavarzinia aquatilis TaxID=2211142 RepID=A0A317E721_9PROT|nr:tyrosine-protein phosphatase [Zavarzinia aquatilis]PWR22837.1 protein-tyrosine-phosphatase [Zavarzinia aquatilis]